MRKDVATIRESIGKITQMLAGRSIKVTQQGDQAFVRADAGTGTPNLVNIPHIPDTASDELIAATQGFLDHEVAHILETDFLARADKSLPDFSRIDMLHNIVEDCWIEPRMEARYAGSAYNLSKVRELVFQVQAQEKFDKIKAMGLETNEMEMIKGFLVVMMRALAGHDECRDFMDRNNIWPLFPSILEPIKAFFPDEIHACQNSHDTLQLALKVYDILKGEMDPGEGEPEKSDAGESDDSSDSDDEGESGDDKSSDENKSAEGEDEESADSDEDGSGKGESDAAENGSKDKDKDKSEDESEDGEGESEDESGEGEDEEEDYSDSRDDMTGALDDILSFEEEITGATKNLYLEALTQLPKDSWLVFTSDFDKVETYKVSSKYRSEWLQQMEDNVRAHIGPMQKEIERLILSKRRTLYQPGMRQGRINPSSLHRLQTKDDRVFRKKHEQRDKNTAVKLLVDLSGSMNRGPGSKMDLAMQSAYGLAQTLERCRIPVEVTGFTTVHVPHHLMKDIDASEKRIGREYSVAYEANYTLVFKSWRERMTSEINKRFADMRFDGKNVRANNIDPIAVENALRDLAQREEERKILIVLSDGQPAFHGDIAASYEHLREVVKQGERSGMEVIGIGIMTNAVEKYYEKNAVIKKVEELPSTLMSQLRQILLN